MIDQPTPRTDAAEMNTLFPHSVSADFARTLERENAALRDALENARSWMMEVMAACPAKDFPGTLDMRPEEAIDAVLAATKGDA